MEFYKETKFKNTEIGRIPNDWDVKEVKSIGQVITGTTPRTKVKEYWNGAYPFVTPTDISETKYVYKTERTVSNKGVEVGRIVPKDTVLVTCIASIGKMALAFKECITNQQINSIICNNKIDPHYIYYIIKNREDELKHSAGKTTNAIVKKSLFEKFLLPLPCTYDEQRRISTILSSIDCLIQQTNSIIQKTQELKKGLMQELLTKGIGHKEFKYSEELGNEIPKEWDVAKIADIFSLEYGKGLTEKKRDDGNFPVFGSNGIVGYHSEYLVNGPGLIVGRKGTIGAITWSDKNFWPIDTTYYVKLKTETDLKWLFYKLNSMDLAELNMATGTPGLNRDLVYSEKISFPPILEQRRIASILSNVDDQIEKERRTKEELERLKKGLMQILLTGKVRVKVN